MRFTNVAVSAAFAVALGISGAASAATLVGGVTVTDVDLPTVQARCDQMVGDTSESLGKEDAATTTATNTDGSSKTIDDITIQDCVTAGLLPADTVVPAAPATN